MTDIQTIGLIGSGHIGAVVARLSVAAGYSVVLSNSRGPETLTDLVDALGTSARAGTAAEAADAGDLVVVTVPLKAYAAVPVEPLVGKVVIDTNNYYPERDGVIDALEHGHSTTSGLLQTHLAGAFVVKAFNNIFYRALEELPRPAGAADRTTLPIFGDHVEARQVVGSYLDRLGYDTLDGGGLDLSWRAENGKPAYVYPYANGGDVRDPKPASTNEIARLLGSAVRNAGQPRTARSRR